MHWHLVGNGGKVPVGRRVGRGGAARRVLGGRGASTGHGDDDGGARFSRHHRHNLCNENRDEDFSGQISGSL